MTAILTERRGAVAILTINRPETLNALDVPTLIEFETVFAALEADAAVRVIVVTGAGERAFVAGGDIADLDSRQGLAHYLEFAEVIHRVFARVENCDKPTIGAVNGWALGGGTELVLALDLRIAADSARLGLPEITLGLFPGQGHAAHRAAVAVVPRQGTDVHGDHITAQEAVAIGLVNKVVPKAEVLSTALALADKIAAKSPLVLKLLKRTLRHGADMPLAAALPFEQAMIGLVLDSRDAHEGCSAFVEKRTPQFKGN